MEKTKKDIQYHLNNVAYNKIAAHKIVAFLLGKGIIAKGEKLNFKEVKDGDKVSTFDNFYKWYTSCRNPLFDLLDFLSDEMVTALAKDNWRRADKISRLIEFVLEASEVEEKNEKSE